LVSTQKSKAGHRKLMSRYTDETVSIPRLTSFSDGVFAIAVTLLVFNLKVPHIPANLVHQQLPSVILGMLPNFSTYVISFLLVAIYWTFHHRMMNLVVRIDTPFLWMNIYYLLVISFIPFPSALFGSYSHETFSFVFYVCCMVTVNLLSMTMLAYASYKSRLIKSDLPAAIIKYLFYRLFASFVVFALSIPLAFYQLRWALYYLFIIFPVNWAMKRYFKRYERA
jgi:uncharacterized membrane protein